MLVVGRRRTLSRSNRVKTSKPSPSPAYESRIIDAELDELLEQLQALVIEGPKGVGKTATAARRARTTFRLDDPGQRALVLADTSVILTAAPPVLLDEWQYAPSVWDVVRRAVDDDATPNHFLLAGSAVATNAPMHSGAGRIPSVRMRPMALSERGLGAPTVSLRALLDGDRPKVSGTTEMNVAGYTREIMRSGFPRIRASGGRASKTQLNGYVERVVDRDFAEQGHVVRKPDTLRRWLCAFAAATSTPTTLEKIRDAAGRTGSAPTRATVDSYCETLRRLWILDEVPGWSPSRNRLGRLGLLPKHHLADPALAAALLDVDERALLAGIVAGPGIAHEGALFGQLFESLVTLSVRVYAQAAEADLFHFREKDGRHEIDLILEGRDGRILAIEVKLNPATSDDDVAHLHWLERKLGREQIADLVVINTGRYAYRRQDGVAVVPAALLGP